MTMNRDLFLAILSMDSYNRGYGVGINGLDTPGPNNSQNLTIKIGNATILRDANDTAGIAQAAGFYAIAYDMTGVAGFTDGERVIAYRGTDDNFGSERTGGSDLWYGYGLAVGLYAQPQPELAIQFYQAVAGIADGANPLTANITTTGHSLGGGLAGYVAKLYGRNGVLFDNMTFELSADHAFNAALQSSSTQEQFFGTFDPVAPSAENLSAFAVENEFLWALRGTSGQSLDVTPLDSHGEGLNVFTQYHSMALLVNVLWARDNAGSTWYTAGPQLWNAYFDGVVADSVSGINNRTVAAIGDSASTLRTAISYSAIDKGERPFGDTGIWSMFNDAGDLGTVLAGEEAALFDSKVVTRFRPIPIIGGDVIPDVIDMKQYLADVLVQYAGALALYEVEQAQGGKIQTSLGEVDTREGILGLSDDETVLALDTSSILWGEVLKSNGVSTTKLTADRLDPVQFTEFKSAYFEQADETSDFAFFKSLERLFGFSGRSYDEDELTELVKLGWGEVWGAGIDADNVDRFHMAAREGLANVTLDERSYSVPTAPGGDAKLHIDVYIGQAGNETITGTQGSDLIIGGGGLVMHLRNEQAANDNGAGERKAA